MSLGPRDKMFCLGPRGHALGQELWGSVLCSPAGREKGTWSPTRRERTPLFPTLWPAGLPWGHTALRLLGHCEAFSPQGVAVKLPMFAGISSIKAKIDEFQWDKLWGAKEKTLRRWVWGGNFLLSCCGFLLSFFFSFPFVSLFIKSRCYMNAPVKYYMPTS